MPKTKATPKGIVRKEVPASRNRLGRGSVKAIPIIIANKPKLKSNGPVGAPQLRPHHFKKGAEWTGNAKGRPTGSFGSVKISQAYAQTLQAPISREIAEFLQCDEGTTWADAIALQAARRAVGYIDGDGVCFTAITELRETTEGKTIERSELSGANGAPLNQAPIQVNFIKAKDGKKDES